MACHWPYRKTQAVSRKPEAVLPPDSFSPQPLGPGAGNLTFYPLAPSICRTRSEFSFTSSL